MKKKYKSEFLSAAEDLVFHSKKDLEKKRNEKTEKKRKEAEKRKKKEKQIKKSCFLFLV